MLLLCSLVLYCQAPSKYWYNNHGQRVTAYDQNDVFACRFLPGAQILDSLPATIVRSVITRSQDPDQLTIIEFVPGLADSLYQNVRATLRLHPHFECEFDVINQESGRLNTEQGWSAVDEQLLVTFRDPNFSQAEIAAFKQRHHLRLVWTPAAGLPQGYSHCYVFAVNPPVPCLSSGRSIDICRDIWETDSVSVLAAEPNLLMAFQPASNDPKYVQEWYLQNTGQSPLAYNHGPGTVDADHDIDWMWSQGYRGEGIRVAVVDLDGFDLEHEDMVGAFIDPWNAITNAPLAVGNHLSSGARAHGMCVAGIVGARSDNATGVAGAAPACKIEPINVNSAYSVMIQALQHAMLNYNVDSQMVHVLNMSLVSQYPLSSLQTTLQVAKRACRNGKGMIIVAAGGNNDTDSTIYPAGYPEVISVIASTPDDKRKIGGDGWETSSFSPWGSNYSDVYDVAAGGSLMPTTDHSGALGYRQNPDAIGHYYDFQGTSGASPLVASVCALLLQANPNLIDTGNGTWQVRDAIRAGAEKKHPTLYDYNAYPLEPGRSLEMGFGRLNGFNSLQLVGLQREATSIQNAFAVYSNREDEEIKIYTNLGLHEKYTDFVLTNVLGQELFRSRMSPNDQVQAFSVQALGAGIYFGFLQRGDEIVSKVIRFGYY